MVDRTYHDGFAYGALGRLALGPGLGSISDFPLDSRRPKHRP